MPEGLKQPKTQAEQGVYIAWIFSDMKDIKEVRAGYTRFNNG